MAFDSIARSERLQPGLQRGQGKSWIERPISLRWASWSSGFSRSGALPFLLKAARTPPLMKCHSRLSLCVKRRLNGVFIIRPRRSCGRKRWRSLPPKPQRGGLSQPRETPWVCASKRSGRTIATLAGALADALLATAAPAGRHGRERGSLGTMAGIGRGQRHRVYAFGRE